MIAVLTGAGISAESGLSTFRDSGGLWEGHDVMEVASPQGWAKNPELVNNFYNLRRRALQRVKPNAAHMYLASLERNYNVQIITQNVDNLHEQAGSSSVLHLHGELLKVRSTRYPDLVYDWTDDLALTDLCERGHSLRPDIVWFGEDVPLIPVAASIISKSRVLLIIGTSLQVYPAAGLMHCANPDASVIYIDPQPAQTQVSSRSLHVIPKKATESLEDLEDLLAEILNP